LTDDGDHLNRGFHLGFGVVLAVAMWAFALIAQDVLAGGQLAALDAAFAQAARADTTLWRSIYWYSTWLGSGYVVVPVVLVIAMFLFRRGQRLLAIIWYASQAGAWWLDAVLKEVFVRPRPDGWDPLLAANDRSFPSGHAMGCFTFAGVATFMLLRLVPPSRMRTLLIVAMLAWSAAMGFSRAYLGVHYASDVIGGFVAGIGWVAVCVSVVEAVSQKSRVKSQKYKVRSSVVRGSEVRGSDVQGSGV